MLEHSIGDLAIHFVTWILGGRNLLIHYTGVKILKMESTASFYR